MEIKIIKAVTVSCLLVLSNIALASDLIVDNPIQNDGLQACLNNKVNIENWTTVDQVTQLNWSYGVRSFFLHKADN